MDVSKIYSKYYWSLEMNDLFEQTPDRHNHWKASSLPPSASSLNVFDFIFVPPICLLPSRMHDDNKQREMNNRCEYFRVLHQYIYFFFKLWRQGQDSSPHFFSLLFCFIVHCVAWWGFFSVVLCPLCRWTKNAQKILICFFFPSSTSDIFQSVLSWWVLPLCLWAVWWMQKK